MCKILAREYANKLFSSQHLVIPSFMVQTPGVSDVHCQSRQRADPWWPDGPNIVTESKQQISPLFTLHSSGCSCVSAVVLYQQPLFCSILSLAKSRSQSSFKMSTINLPQSFSCWQFCMQSWWAFKPKRQAQYKCAQVVYSNLNMDWTFIVLNFKP